MGERIHWKGPGGDQFLKDAWDLLDKAPNLKGLGSRTDPETGITYRIRKNDNKSFNKEKRTGLKIQPVGAVEGITKGIKASGKDRHTRINKATLTEKQFINEARAFFKENNIKKLDGQNASQVGKRGHQNYQRELRAELSRINRLGLTAAHIRPTTDTGFIESAQNYYAEELGKNAADKARVPTKRQQKLTKTDLTKSTFMRSQMGLGQKLDPLSDNEVRTILDRSRIRVARRSVANNINPKVLKEAGWFGKNSINSRMGRVLNIGKMGGGSLERLKSDFDFLENDGPARFNSKLINSQLFEPREVITMGGNFSGV